MAPKKQTNDAVYSYLDLLKSRVIQESGLQSDEYHIGKLIIRSLKDTPDALLQIDAGTGETETFGSVLERSIQCAGAFRKLGLQVGDVIDVMMSNHLDLTIPFYAALYLGITTTQTNWNYTENEMQHSFRTCKPRVVFCHPSKSSTIRSALDGAGLCQTVIITIGDESDPRDLRRLLKEQEQRDSIAYDFQATNFDPEETFSFLVPTSGTTGLPKAATLTHKNLLAGASSMWSWTDVFPGPTRLILVWSPLQWITAIGSFTMSAILKFPRVHTSKQETLEHLVETINAYKPSSVMINPTTFTRFSKFIEGEVEVDLSCFDTILFGGSAITEDVIAKQKQLMPNATTIIAYGMSEMAGLSFFACDHGSTTIGKTIKQFQYRLIDAATGRDIHEPNVPGELWVKGDAVFRGYYNKPESTAETLTEDGWLKTGDILYKDADGYYYFVDRLKLMFKYKMDHVSPVEVENVLRQHECVGDAAVCGLPDAECGALPVACVTRRGEVTAQQLKDLVKNSLSDSKQLRGGVIFFDSLPVTAVGKIDRKKLRELAITLPRE